MTLTPHVKHLIIAGAIAIVIIVVTWKVIAYAGGIAHDQRVLAEEKLANDLAVAKVQAVASAAASADLQQKLDAQTAATARLQADILKLRSDLAVQRDRDAQLPPDALAVRWQGLIGKGVVASAPGGLLADLPAAHETVSELEELPVLREEKAKVEAVSAGKDQTIMSAQNLVTAVKSELSTCQQTVKDADAVCKAKMAEGKAAQRKRNIIIAIASAVGGFLLRGRL